jgi:hypothetical protein
MRTTLCIAAAVAGSMLLTGLVSGSAQATPAPVLKSNADLVTLVARKGGGGGGGMKGMSRGGGGGMKGLSRGGGGSGKLSRSGGNRSYAYRSGGGSSHMKRGSMSRGNYALKDRGSVSRSNYDLKDRGYKNRDAFKSGGKKHYASKDRDHDNHGKFNNRHRVFRNGAWIWVYGTGYTAYGNDCYWLRRQASITGSPYWWSRYNQCVGYDYY